MTDHRDIERLLDAWFAEGPTRVADPVFDAAIELAARQNQRPAWRLKAWRLPAMSTPVRLAFVAAAVLVALVLGAILISGGHRRLPTVGPTTTPPAAPAVVLSPPPAKPSPKAEPLGPSASVGPSSKAPIDLTTSGTSLQAATYYVDLPAGHVELTFPDGWQNDGVGENDFIIAPKGTGITDAQHAVSGEVDVAFDMRRPPPLPGCRRPIAAHSDARSLAQDLRADPDVAISPGSDRTITIGAMVGHVMDISLAAPTANSCRDQNGHINLLEAAGLGDVDIYLQPGQRIRLVLLDAPGHHTVMIAIVSTTGDNFDQLVAVTMPIVATLVFEPTPTSSSAASPSRSPR